MCTLTSRTSRGREVRVRYPATVWQARHIGKPASHRAQQLGELDASQMLSETPIQAVAEHQTAVRGPSEDQGIDSSERLDRHRWVVERSVGWATRLPRPGPALRPHRGRHHRASHPRRHNDLRSTPDTNELMKPLLSGVGTAPAPIWPRSRPTDPNCA
jgi:hypothetical protein